MQRLRRQMMLNRTAFRNRLRLRSVNFRRSALALRRSLVQRKAERQLQRNRLGLGHRTTLFRPQQKIGMRQAQLQMLKNQAQLSKLRFGGFTGMRGRGYQMARNRRRGLRGGKRYAGHFDTDSGLWQSIGSQLTQKLQPNRQRFDLFDKNLRADTVRKYILNNNGLQNIGTGLKKANGSATMNLSQEIPFPSRISRMFAISIRPARFENLVARLGPWERHLTKWPGTLGTLLDKNKLIRDKVVAASRLKRGEIGCYDAHYRLWRHMSENNIPNALILEDDADINYSHETANRINKMFDDLQEHNVQYDVVYLGHNDRKRPKKMFGSRIGIPGGTQGLFMYYLTLEGARKLISNAIPMTQAVDDYVYVSKSIRQFTLEPRLGWVVNIERSDTANIV